MLFLKKIFKVSKNDQFMRLPRQILKTSWIASDLLTYMYVYVTIYYKYLKF